MPILVIFIHLILHFCLVWSTYEVVLVWTSFLDFSGAFGAKSDFIFPPIKDVKHLMDNEYSRTDSVGT